MIKIFLLLCLTFSGAAMAAPCNSGVFNANYICPDGQGGAYMMRLAHRKMNNSDAISVVDNEYRQIFIADSSKYNATPIGQTIGLCSGDTFTVDIYSQSGNLKIQSQIRMSAQDLTSRAVSVSKSVRYPNQSAVTRSYICLRK